MLRGRVRGGGEGSWEVLGVSSEVCGDGSGVGDQEMESMRSEQRIFSAEIQTQVACAAGE